MDKDYQDDSELQEKGPSTDGVALDLAHSYEKVPGGVLFICESVNSMEHNDLFMAFFPKKSASDTLSSDTLPSDDDDDHEDYFPER